MYDNQSTLKKPETVRYAI